MISITKFTILHSEAEKKKKGLILLADQNSHATLMSEWGLNAAWPDVHALLILFCS